MEALGERTLWLDCDVLQAGRWDAVRRRYPASTSRRRSRSTASVSRSAHRIGRRSVRRRIVDGTALLDLDYEEDSGAEVDVNVVTTGEGELIEVQATAERVTYSRDRLDELLDIAATVASSRSPRAQRDALAA